MEQITHTSVALDNVTLSTEAPVDPAALLLLGEIYNKYLEDNRDAIAQALSDLICFGTCQFPAP